MLHGQATACTSGAQALFNLGVKRCIAHDAPFANVFGLQFKLRLDQHEHMPARSQQGCQRRQNEGERNKRQITHNQIKPHGCICRACARNWPCRRKNGCVQMPCIHALNRRYTGIGQQLGMQLAMPDVHACDVRCAMRQQAIGQPVTSSPVAANAPSSLSPPRDT